MRTLLTLAGFVLALTTLSAAAQMITLSPTQIGQIFCIARLGNDMAPVTGLLTPALTLAIADAETKDTAWAAANPGEKPPLGDGIPWQTYQDYAPRCAVGTVTAAAGRASVELSYAFPDAPEANFTDTLALVQVADPMASEPLWRIDNLAYSDGGDLKSMLVSAFAN
jgi:hypothetical protein